MLALIGSFLVSLFAGFILTKSLIPFLERNEIIALDLHKPKEKRIANSGGIPVALSMTIGLMFFIAAQTFIFNSTEQTTYLFASILTILLITLIGFFDDLNRGDVLKNKRKIRRGLKQWQKPLFTLPAAIPLMVVNAGVSTMTIPFIGSINFGILYPLLLIPLGLVCAANAVNLLGGFNGSEAGMGVVYCLSLGLYAFLFDKTTSVAIFMSAVGALIGFLVFNWYPAKILSGDSLTYCLGSIVATGVIVGNIEKAGMLIMALFVVEFLLKAMSKFKATCLGRLRKDGKLDSPYGKRIYSLTHLIMNLRPMSEMWVTIILILMQTVVSFFTFYALFLKIV